MNLRSFTLLAALLLVSACADNTPANTSNQGNAGGQNQTSANQVTPGSREDFVQNVGDKVYFDFDRSDIKAEGQQTLRRQADWLKKYSNVTITIEGHCDERGTREYNLALGERRASAVKKLLVALGVPANRVSTISYGKERPLVVGSNEAAWAQNRVGVSVIN